MKNKHIFIGSILIVSVLITGCTGSQNTDSTPGEKSVTTSDTARSTPKSDEGSDVKNNVTVEVVPVETQNQNSKTKVTTKTISIAVVGDNFSFTPSEIKVKKGDTVKIQFTNKFGFHDLVLDEFKANSGRIGAGENKEVVFVADKVGTFEYYCSVGNHRAMGMKGNLIVE